LKNIHRLENLEQVKAMAHPIRLQILELLRDEPLTTMQVATILNEKPTRLYHHVDLLDEVGLIRLVETRQNRNLLEKYYLAVAKDFIVDRRVLELSRGADSATSEYESLFLSTLETTLAEVRQSVNEKLISPVQKGRNALMLRQKFTGSESQMRELTQLIKNWLEGLSEIKPDKGDSQYNLTVAFYPVKKEKKFRGKK